MNRHRIETILVTGGFGYLGTSLVNLLLKKTIKWSS